MYISQLKWCFLRCIPFVYISISLIFIFLIIYACPKGTIYQDVFIYIKSYISMSRLDDNISRCTYLHQVLYIYMSRLDDNISRCIYLHHVLYIYVKICIHVKQDFNIRIKIYVHVSRSACEYIKSNKYWSTSSYTDRQSNVISKFAYSHQDSHLHIKIRIYTSRASHIHQDLYIEIVIGLYDVLSEKFAWLLRTILA